MPFKNCIFGYKTHQLKSFTYAIFFILITSCLSVKTYNQRLEKSVGVEKLHQDIDFVNHQLQKLHPNLYWYISKEKLDYQFDSLKQSIKTPLPPHLFFEKLAPIITKVKEGHLALTPPMKRLTNKERKKVENQKGLFGRMNYVVDQNRLYVKDNADKFEGIKVGTEILKINDLPIQEYLKKYENYITGDGENTTFKKYALAGRWAIYFTVEKGIMDSVKIQTSYQNQIKDFYIHREPKTKVEKEEEKKLISTIKKNETQKTKDYNPVTRAFNRDLQFLAADSSIAYMKVKTFSGDLSSKFYKQSFKRIKNNKSKYLILDIRDNLGGSLNEIHNLYSYLALEKFQFIDDIEITQYNSVLHADYFDEFPNALKPIAAIGYPFYAIGTLLSSKKKNGKFYLRNNNIISIKKPKKDAFEGKIYLLINGSSFSASAIIASKLKNDKRAFLVGEETGGANDGTVAGRYSTKQLPHSHLYLPIGLMLIQPHITFGNTRKGVTPDAEVISSLYDVLSKKDPQLDWIKKDIKQTASEVLNESKSK